MEQTSKIQTRPLTLSPKALQKALTLSASRAQKMADAFGLKVPVARGPKPLRHKAVQPAGSATA